MLKAGAVFAAAAATFLVTSPSNAQEPFTWAGRVASGRTLEVKNINGDLVAVAASGDQVRVTATKRGERNDPDSIEVRVIEHAAGVTICAVYPAPPRREPNELKSLGSTPCSSR